MISIRLLDYDRPAHSPWLTVALAERELELLAAPRDSMTPLDNDDVIPEIIYPRAVPFATLMQLAAMEFSYSP